MEWTRSSFEPHPPGVFKAQFVEWKPEKHEKFGEQCRLTFDTEEEMSDGRPYRISTWTKPSLHKKGKVSKMLAAWGIDSEQWSDAEVKAFNLDDYCGRKLMLVIENETEDGQTKHKIVSFQPMARKKKATTEPEPESPGDRQDARETQPEPAAVGAPAGKKPDWDDED